MKQNSLIDLVSPIISLNEFNAKAGTNNEVIVLAIYLEDQEPAKELNKFIQRGFLNFLDSDVSPNPDENGKYIVFVEFKNTDQVLNHIYKLIEDIENLTGKLNWKFKLHHINSLFDIKDPQIEFHLNSNPGIFSESLSLLLTNDGINHQLSESILTINCSIGANVRCNIVSYSDNPITALNEAYVFESTSEKKLLQMALGDIWNISQYGKKFVAENNGNYIVLQDVEQVYS